MNDRVRRRRGAARRKRRVTTVIVATGSVALVCLSIVVAVSVRGDDEPELGAAARAGQQAAVRGGCVGCHGRSGEGVTGPAWVGLFGSTVTLDDASTVVADRNYLVESIIDPAAKKRAGGWPNMPPDSMIGNADVAAIVDYIEALATPTTQP